MKELICKSGAIGWQDRLQKVYSSFKEFVHYCEYYNIHGRLGFKSKVDLWKKNPIIGGSVRPDDICIVKEK